MPDPTPPVDLSRYDFGVYDPPMSEQTPIPAEALEAAAKVALRRYESEHYVSPDVTWQSFVAEIHEFVEAAAPALLAAGRTAAAEREQSLINALADCVVKSTEYGIQDGGFVANYITPTGPIHRAIPLLQELGVTVRPGFDGRVAARVAENGPSMTTCTEPGCHSTADGYCGGPTGAGCGEPFCGEHLFVTERDGYLCSADYNGIEDRPFEGADQ